VEFEAQSPRWKIAAVLTLCVGSAALVGYFLRPVGQEIGSYRYTPFATNAFTPIWSPDGKAVAYSAKVNGTLQVFLRYLNSPVSALLTHEKHDTRPLGWSSDKSHLILLESPYNRESPLYDLYSVAVVGGEPEFVMNADCDACDVSRDGKTFATFAKGKDGSYGVLISDPLGSPLRPYTPAPFATRDIFNVPKLSFSPDGKRILLYRTGDADKDEAWLLSLPPGNALPERILKNLHTLGSFSWMPDGQHIIISLSSDENKPAHLWIGEVNSDYLVPLTMSNVSESSPRVSPDGSNILYTQNTQQIDVVSISLENGSAKTFISTGREENMAAWSAHQEKLAWVSNRSGPYEIWVRMPDGTERQAVTASDFPPGTNKWFFNPSLSPDDSRLLYMRIDRAGVARLWISSLSGGSPIRVTSAEPTGEAGGSWSPDGSRIAYLQAQGGTTSLMIVKASGNASPVTVRGNGPPITDVWQGAPEWSPTGTWITYRDPKGWNLISPDGKLSKFLGDLETPYLAFSKNGKLLYGIYTGETEADRDRATLFSLDPMTLKRKVIKELGKDFQPNRTFVLGVRFSISPDDRSLIYSTGKYWSDLWMLEGYRQPLWTDHLRAKFGR
jgi:eukaryotic-like serine/threonine-protein kinase